MSSDFDKMTKEQRSSMTTSFIEDLYSKHIEEEEEEFSSDEYSQSSMDQYHVDPVKLVDRATQKTLNWNVDVNHVDTMNLWDVWGKIYSVYPDSDFLRAVKDFEKHVSPLIIKEGFKSLLAMTTMELLEKQDAVWRERIYGAMLQSKFSSSEQVQSMIDAIGNLQREGVKRQESLIMSFNTVLSSVKVIQEVSNQFSSQINEFIPLFKSVLETKRDIQSPSCSTSSISVNQDIFNFKSLRGEICYNRIHNTLKCLFHIDEQQRPYWVKVKATLNALPSSWLCLMIPYELEKSIKFFDEITFQNFQFNQENKYLFEAFLTSLA